VSLTARIVLAAFVLAMCVLDVVWIRQNVAPPRMFDDSYYLIESVDLFHTLRDRGVVPFLRGTTVHSRQGHPPMMKLLPVFMYLVLGPGVNAALYAYTVLIPVFCLYLFLLARELLDSEAEAVLAVVIACLFPITYGMWRQLLAEFGIAFAVVGFLYHLRKAEGFTRSGHAIAAGFFLGCGFLWKVTFPIFVGGAIVLVLIRSRHRLPARGLTLAFLSMLVVAGPFYATSWLPVVAFTVFAGNPDNQRLWGLGPVFSPVTVARYWLLVVNWGLTPYFFGLFLVSSVWCFARGQLARLTRDNAFLLAAFCPAFVLLTFHPLKEVRHLLPALPLIAIIAAALFTDLVSRLRRNHQLVVLTLLMAWPAYQFASWSFDSPLVPRRDVRWGPLLLSMQNLEAQSLEWMPTYTFPANRTPWPGPEALQLIRSRLRNPTEPVRVHVTGTNPYFNALILSLDARLERLPFVFDPPFTSDYLGADFVITVMANRRYGPVDKRPTAAEQALNGGTAPFVLVGSLILADGGHVDVFEADRRRRFAVISCR
jgi:4-amino-4-deoxy-L-arabinose transferase-like glycosyltransferase